MRTTIIKQNPKGEETWRYSGTILKRTDQYLVVEAFFDREDMEFFGLYLYKGDRFIETYYFNHWYNMFEIHDRSDDRLKGWYCNISSPAREHQNQVIYRDLALDLLVFPDGQQMVLDKEEFMALQLSPKEHQLALDALTELRAIFKDKFKAVNTPP